MAARPAGTTGAPARSAAPSRPPPAAPRAPAPAPEPAEESFSNAGEFLDESAAESAVPPPPAVPPVAPLTNTGSRPALGVPTRTSSGVVSAARMAPVALKQEPQGDIKTRLKSGAQETALNAAGVAKDFLRDFLRTSRYFKYKVMIVAAWVLLSTGTVVTACPGGAFGPSNDLGAELVQAGDAARPVYMIKNMSDEAWTNVTLIANKDYRAVSARIDAGGNFTLTPRQLIGPNGQPAPQDLKIRDLELRTDDGEETLLENGEPP